MELLTFVLDANGLGVTSAIPDGKSNCKFDILLRILLRGLAAPSFFLKRLPSGDLSLT